MKHSSLLNANMKFVGVETVLGRAWDTQRPKTDMDEIWKIWEKRTSPEVVDRRTLQICHVKATHCVVFFVQPSEIFQIDQEQSTALEKVW